MLKKRAASEVEIGLLSDYPETPLPVRGAGRTTVDAREKDKLIVKMSNLTF
jgi:hypothetical protein